MLEGHMGISVQKLTIVCCKVEVILKGINDRIAKLCSQAPLYLPAFPGIGVESQRQRHHRYHWIPNAGSCTGKET